MVNKITKRSKIAKAKNAHVKIDNETFADILGSIGKRLDEHWVYDFAELFTDCAVAIHRISKLLKELKRRPTTIQDKKKLLQALQEFQAFEKEWTKIGNERVNEEVLSPDQIEWFLERMQKAGLAKKRRSAWVKRARQEDSSRSFETVQQIRNPSN